MPKEGLMSPQEEGISALVWVELDAQNSILSSKVFLQTGLW